MWTLLNQRVRARVAMGIFALTLASLPTIGETRESRAGLRDHEPSAHLGIRDDGPRFFTIASVLAKRDVRSTSPAGTRDGARLASASPILPPSMLQQPRVPFGERGFHLFESSNASIAQKWSQLQSSWAREQRQIDACRRGDGGCTPAARQFIEIGRMAARLPMEARAAYVNRRVNASVRYVSDFSKHGIADRWDSPLRALAGTGDCEEYAFAKHFLLIAAGVPASSLRIVLLRDNRVGEDHAVLAVRRGMGWQILDNRWNRIHDTHELTHYRPVVSIGTDGLRLFAAPYVDTASAMKSVTPASGWITENIPTVFIGEEP